MRCPYCKSPFEPIERNAFANADTYDKPVHALSICCNKIVRIAPVRAYRLDISTKVLEDDWGNKP